MSSPEKWEIKQLIVDSTDYTGNTGVLPAEGSDEDVIIN